MAGNQTDMRRKADERLASAIKNGADRKTIGELQATRDAARDTELKATGGNRQAGER